MSTRYFKHHIYETQFLICPKGSTGIRSYSRPDIDCLLLICCFSLFPYSPSVSTVDLLSKIYLKFIFFSVSAASILILKTGICSFEQDGRLLVSFCLPRLSHCNSCSLGHTEWPLQNMSLASSLCCPDPSVVHPWLVAVIPHWTARLPRPAVPLRPAALLGSCFICRTEWLPHVALLGCSICTLNVLV